MKTLIILYTIALCYAFAICSCSNESGVELVRTTTNLKIYTYPMEGYRYADYENGDSVVVVNSLKGTYWHIDPNIELQTVDKLNSMGSQLQYRKGVIIK